MALAQLSFALSVASGVEASFLTSRSVRSHRACAGLSGKPTSYRANGCWRTSNVNDESVYDGYHSMSIEECFAFCSFKKGAKYFGVSEGNKCWCGSIWHGDELDAKSCDASCAGNDLQKCGGIDATNVYVMYDCTEDTPAEKKATTKEEKDELLNSFGAFTEQTCGQAAASKTKVGGSETKVGSLDQCKLACWQAAGAETCHGFTYEEDSEKCTFHQDVLDGDVVYKPRTACYFKMV